MPSFTSPKPRYHFNISAEKSRITKHFTKRGVPKSTPGRLLLASWNIANLGNQKRTPGALKLIAHILRRFDLVAVQEVNDNFSNWLKVLKEIGSGFDYIMSDTAGNNERLLYLYRKSLVQPTNLYGELALRPRNYPKRTVKVRWTDSNKKDRIQTVKNFKFTPFQNHNQVLCCGSHTKPNR